MTLFLKSIKLAPSFSFEEAQKNVNFIPNKEKKIGLE